MNQGLVQISWLLPAQSSDGAEPRAWFASSNLIPHLSAKFEVRVYVAGSLESAAKAERYFSAKGLNIRCFGVEDFLKNQGAASPAFCVYQLTGAASDEELSDLLQRYPGIVWFHDVYWKKNRTRQIQSPEERSHPSLMWDEFELATCSLFSSARGMEIVSRHWKQSMQERGCAEKKLPIYFLPIPVRNHGAVPDISLGRKKGVLYCGSPNVENHAHVLLRALSEYFSQRESFELHWLLDASEEAAARCLLREFALEGKTIFSPRDSEIFLEKSHLCGLFVDLHFSAHGGMRHFLPLAFAERLATVVLDFGETEQLLGSLVFKIQPGGSEVHELREVLSIVFSESAAKQEKVLKMTDLARSYAEETHDDRRISAEFSWLIQNIASAVKHCSASERSGNIDVGCA